jgi:hypothetical protein
MNISVQTSWIAVARGKCVASGAPRKVATEIKAFADSNPEVNVLVLDAVTSEPVEIDLRGSVSTVLRRLPKPPTSEPAIIVASQTPVARAAGRPKLGVIAREVTLLPRHWEWLATQPGGASVALRKLVEHAQRANRHADRVREAREAAYRFMSVMAGDEPGFEEATRAVFAGDLAHLHKFIKKWPPDIRKHTLSLAENLTVTGNELEHAP